jgi:hypothetical protein
MVFLLCFLQCESDKINIDVNTIFKDLSISFREAIRISESGGPKNSPCFDCEYKKPYYLTPFSCDDHANLFLYSSFGGFAPMVNVNYYIVDYDNIQHIYLDTMDTSLPYAIVYAGSEFDRFALAGKAFFSRLGKPVCLPDNNLFHSKYIYVNKNDAKDIWHRFSNKKQNRYLFLAKPCIVQNNFEIVRTDFSFSEERNRLVQVTIIRK